MLEFLAFIDMIHATKWHFASGPDGSHYGRPPAGSCGASFAALSAF